VPLHILHCHSSLDELRSRLQARRGDVSEATVAVLEKQVSYWEAFGPEELPYVLEVDTRNEAQVREVIERCATSTESG
jgi:predicted kinase